MAVVSSSLVGHWQPGVEADGLQYVLAVPGEAVQPGGDGVLQVAGQALHVHRHPVGVIRGQLEHSQDWMSILDFLFILPANRPEILQIL